MTLRLFNLALVSIAIAVASCGRNVNRTNSTPETQVQQSDNGEGDQGMALTQEQSKCVDEKKDKLQKNNPAVESLVKLQLLYNIVALRKIQCMTDPDKQREALIALINSNEKLAGVVKDMAKTITLECNITDLLEKTFIKSAIRVAMANRILEAVGAAPPKDGCDVQPVKKPTESPRPAPR